jgi:hypothetical protein
MIAMQWYTNSSSDHQKCFSQTNSRDAHEVLFFFNTISQKVINPDTLDGLQHEVVKTLCQLENWNVFLWYHVPSHCTHYVWDKVLWPCDSPQYVPIWAIHGNTKSITVVIGIDPRPALSKDIQPRRWLPFAQTTCLTNSLLVCLVLSIRGCFP